MISNLLYHSDYKNFKRRRKCKIARRIRRRENGSFRFKLIRPKWVTVNGRHLSAVSAVLDGQQEENWFYAYKTVFISIARTGFSLLLILLVRLFGRKKGGNNPDDNEIAFSTRLESRPARADTRVNTGNSRAKECHHPLISFQHFIVFARDLKFSRRKLILAL